MARPGACQGMSPGSDARDAQVARVLCCCVAQRMGGVLKKISKFLCGIAFILAASGCTPGPALESIQVRIPVRGALGAYTLGPNDQVRVQVYNEAAITGDYVVDSAGFVAIPVAGRVKAAGLTTEQLERRITSKLNGDIIKDAHVTVQISNYAPFYVRGEVKKPGEFPYKPGLTLGDAVALAGGYTYRADESKAFVRPVGTGREIIHPLGVDPPISPGDNIRIPERFF
jgi:protein involved in polysaccharide export with SLBB domain